MPRTGVDYADYNITVYRYCPYQCLYCWAWRVPLNAKRIQGGKYVPEIEAERIAMRMKPDEIVVVSFTSDPYPLNEAWENRTRRVIFALRYYGCGTIMILTKNPLLALKDRDIMLTYIAGAKCYVETWLGTTITSIDTVFPFSHMLEANAPRTKLRLMALREYQKQGGKVWLSIEPIIPAHYSSLYPENIVKKIITELDPDKIALVVLGRLNYIRQIKKHMPISMPSEKKATEFYREHVPEAIDILKQHGIPYHVKKELEKVIK